MDSSTLASFIGISMLLTLAPGPDILYVIAQSITRGKRAGIATAAGLCTGLIAHTAAAVLGVSAILQQSVLAFTVLKYAGAAYLFFLAWKSLREKAPALAAEPLQQENGRLFRQGIYMNILNPKVGLFFLAFLPQFVDPHAGAAEQMLGLGLLFMLQAMLIFSGVAVFAGSLGRRILANQAIARKINYTKGGLFALIGLKLALTDR